MAQALGREKGYAHGPDARRVTTQMAVAMCKAESSKVN